MALKNVGTITNFLLVLVVEVEKRIERIKKRKRDVAALRLLLLLRFLLRFRLFALLGFYLLVLCAVVDDADVA